MWGYRRPPKRRRLCTQKWAHVCSTSAEEAFVKCVVSKYELVVCDRFLVHKPREARARGLLLRILIAAIAADHLRGAITVFILLESLRTAADIPHPLTAFEIAEINRNASETN
ncbi:hypothetical protein Plhal304r1_c019g0067521 [Plasmopara halstedii]